jgi:hypothetical protein
MDFSKLSKLNNFELIDVAETFAWELRANRKELASSNSCAWIDDAYWLINALFDRIGDLNEERFQMQATINHQVKEAIKLVSTKAQGNS